MELRIAQEKDYMQIAKMKWLHCGEDDVVISSMFVYVIPKTPKPNRKQKYISYLTNVYTLKEYRNKKIGTELLTYVKEYLAKEDCELIFVWPSENSINWYARNEFKQENEIYVWES